MLEITPEIKKDIRVWVDALRSGEYPQTKYSLQDKTGYCCLGVACEVLIPKADQKRDLNGRLRGITISYVNQPRAPLWLIAINQKFKDTQGDYLSCLNDNGKFGGYPLSFLELADVIEETYLTTEENKGE